MSLKGKLFGRRRDHLASPSEFREYLDRLGLDRPGMYNLAYSTSTSLSQAPAWSAMQLFPNQQTTISMKETPQMSSTKQTIEDLLKYELPSVLTPIKEESVDNEDAYKEYVALATKLGVNCRALKKRDVMLFFQREEIPVYDFAIVTDFLNKLQASQNAKSGIAMRWAWTDLAAYADTIPLFALRLIDRVKTKYPDAKFNVSQLNMPRPDPFLLVSIKDQYFVIAHWDEPGFKLNGK